MNSECRVCRANSGVERISPGPPIYDGEFWVVEHAYPTSLLGWLVIVLKRHAEALHELTPLEGRELGLLQRAVSRALQQETKCMKEYSIFFAEIPEFRHVHVHMVPRAEDLSPELRGGRIFAHLKAPPDDVIAPSVVTDVCLALAPEVSSEMKAGTEEV